MVTGSFLSVKRPQRSADRSSLPSARLRKVSGYSAVSPLCGCTGMSWGDLHLKRERWSPQCSWLMIMVTLRVESYRQKVEGADMTVRPHFGARRCVQDMLCRCWSHCVQTSWHMMAHAQKPDFHGFPPDLNGPVRLNRRGRQFSRLLAAEVCASTVVMLYYTMFRGSVKSIGYPLHSTVSLSLPLPCVTVCHHVSTGVYKKRNVESCWTKTTIECCIVGP